MFPPISGDIAGNVLLREKAGQAESGNCERVVAKFASLLDAADHFTMCGKGKSHGVTFVAEI